MDGKNAIEIPPHLLSKFSNEQITEDEPAIDGNPMDGFVTDMAERSLAKLAGVFDETMKERGGVGLAGISEDDFARVGVIALEDIIPREVLENSPKATFATMCVYIGAANGVAIKRSNKKKEQAQNGNENAEQNENLDG